jgi:hypothetical protein
MILLQQSTALSPCTVHELQLSERRDGLTVHLLAFGFLVDVSTHTF